MPGDVLVADVTITWAAALGVLACIVFIRQRRTQSALERKTLFLLYCLFALFAVRGLLWLTESMALGMIVFAAASLLPLASTLFTESLMRRHAAPWFKWTVLLGTPLALAANLYAHTRHEAPWLAVFACLLLFTLAYNGLRILRRDTRSLSAAENALLDAMLVTAIVALLLAATDFRTTLLDGFPVRLGALGGLVFVFVLSSYREFPSHRRVVAELFTYAGVAALLSLPFIALLGSATLETAVPVWAMVFTLILTMVAIEQLRRHRRGERLRDFRQWLLDGGIRDMEDLLARLRKAASRRECLLVERSELDGYDPDVIGALLERSGGVINRAEARPLLDSPEACTQEAAEQLLDLMARYAMTHVCLVGRSPCSLLLFSLPEIASGRDSAEPQLVYAMARMLEARG